LILTELETGAEPDQAKEIERKAVEKKRKARGAVRSQRWRNKHGYKAKEITLPTGQTIRECPACTAEGRVVPGTNFPPGYKVRDEFVDCGPGRWTRYCYDHNEKNKEENRTQAEWDRDANNRAFRDNMEKKRVADNLELLRRRQEKEAKAAAAKNAEKTG